MDANQPPQASVHACRDGGRLHYSTAGSGEPVVLIHGFSLDRALWEPQWQALGARHRVIAYDLRGYGESTLPAGPYGHVADLLELGAALDALSTLVPRKQTLGSSRPDRTCPPAGRCDFSVGIDSPVRLA